MKIFSYSNREEAKKYIWYPCLFSDEYFALCNLDMTDITVGILSSVKDDEELPFFSDITMDYGYRYCLPIPKECIDEVEELAKRFNIEQLYAAIKYKVEVKNVQK